MKTWQIEGTGSIDKLALAERARPVPGPNEVLVRIRAVSLNYRDLINVRGTLGGLRHPNLVPASDGAGEVAAIGPGTTRFKPGDRVIGIFRQRWISGPYQLQHVSSDLGGGIDGVLSEFVALHEEGLVLVPDALTFEEAACLPCAGVTAWNAVVTRGQARIGETVLIQGTGGVGLFSVQFAKASGARVIVTTSSDAKAVRLESMGVDAVVNYRTHPDWDKKVLELTDGAGADLVVENGGPLTWSKSIHAARVGGRVMLVGLLTGIDDAKSGPVFLPIFIRETTVTSVHVGSREMFEEMKRGIAQHGIRPVVDKVFAFDQAREAYQYLESGRHFGKIVISLA